MGHWGPDPVKQDRPGGGPRPIASRYEPGATGPASVKEAGVVGATSALKDHLGETARLHDDVEPGACKQLARGIPAGPVAVHPHSIWKRVQYGGNRGP